MQTRSKSGIFKPKLLIVTACPEPANVSLALTDPNWKKAMNDEYQALIRTKLKVDGFLDKYKHLVLISLKLSVQ